MNRIRLATANDIAIIFDIRTHVKENHLSIEQLIEMDITPATILTLMQSHPCIWVVENEEKVVGFSIVDIEEGCVFATFVHPENEGRGIGKMLMEKAEHALFTQHQSIWLETDKNSRACKFYQSLGWSAVEFFPNGDVKMEKSRP